MDKIWEAAYYRETSRPKRKEMLDEAVCTDGMTCENELRLRLYEARYGESEQKGREVDYFIRGWMTLEYIKTAKGFWHSDRKIRRERKSLLEDWKLSLVEEYGELGSSIMYLEYCNLARLYLELCERDHTYGAVVFGIGKMKSVSLQEKLADDIFHVAYVAPEILGVKEELQSFSKAASYIFCQQYPALADKFYRRVTDLEQK